MALVLAAALGLGWWPSGPTVAAMVRIDGREHLVLPLTDARLVPVAGRLGTTEVQIGPQGARVLASPCANQACVRQGWVSHAGAVVACLPNRVVVVIVGPARRGDPDAVSR
jgi:hypothetical protein